MSISGMAKTILDDGVRTVPATQADLATFKIAEQQLNGFSVSGLYDPNDIHARVFFVLADGTGNDVSNALHQPCGRLTA
jgi:hypothetical protein